MKKAPYIMMKKNKFYISKINIYILAFFCFLFNFSILHSTQQQLVPGIITLPTPEQAWSSKNVIPLDVALKAEIKQAAEQNAGNAISQSSKEAPTTDLKTDTDLSQKSGIYIPNSFKIENTRRDFNVPTLSNQKGDSYFIINSTDKKLIEYGQIHYAPSETSIATTQNSAASQSQISNTAQPVSVNQKIYELQKIVNTANTHIDAYVSSLEKLYEDSKKALDNAEKSAMKAITEAAQQEQGVLHDHATVESTAQLAQNELSESMKDAQELEKALDNDQTITAQDKAKAKKMILDINANYQDITNSAKMNHALTPVIQDAVDKMEKAKEHAKPYILAAESAKKAHQEIEKALISAKRAADNAVRPQFDMNADFGNADAAGKSGAAIQSPIAQNNTPFA